MGALSALILNLIFKMSTFLPGFYYTHIKGYYKIPVLLVFILVSCICPGICLLIIYAEAIDESQRSRTCLVGEALGPPLPGQNTSSFSTWHFIHDSLDILSIFLNKSQLTY